MKHTDKGLLLAVWAIITMLLTGTALLPAQAKKKPPSHTQSAVTLLGKARGEPIPGYQFPLRYETSVAHTRPEKANPGFLTGPQYLREGQVLGNEGVVDAGRFILPFGTKGEKVALAFLSGEYVPPQGEKLQPALAQLAQQRAAQLSTQGSSARPAVYALILLNGRLDEGLQAWLQERGVELFGFYPYTAYQARIPVDALNEVASHPQVRWVGQPNPVQKLDPELLYFMGDQTGERIWLCVNLFAADEGAKEAIASMAAETGVYDPSLGVFAIVADAGTVNRLLDMDAVLFVEPIRQATVAHTESMASINADLLWYYGHDGRPQGGVSIKVGVMDSGLSYHWDFYNVWNGTAGYNRTTETDWWDDVLGHGTHVTGTFLGEGVAQFRYRGVAQGLRDTDVDGFDLLISKVFRLGDDGRGVSEGNSVYEGLLDMQGREARYKRQVFNYSGAASGINLRGTDDRSRRVDELFRQNIVPVIAAGNDGPGGGTVGLPGVAKGAFTVGAIYDDELGYLDQVTDYSSRGFTGDGRVKPDVVAPGSWIDSCSNSSNNGYLYNLEGTSFATPHVAGLVAGLIGHYNMPAWATKAVILATAIDLGQPLYAQGYGKVDAMLAHWWSGDRTWHVWWDVNGDDGDLKAIDFNLPQNASLLRVVLVYPDAPAPSGGFWALKNDLDLYLDKEPFQEGPHGEWEVRYELDNVAVIDVYNATPGNYRIKVYTYNQVEDSHQPWAVALHIVYGSLYPNVTISLSAPLEVPLGVDFEVVGEAEASSYVASGVYGSISLSDGLALNEMRYVRFAPDLAEEEISLPGRSGINQGNILAGFTRRLKWILRGTQEGWQNVTYTIHSINGGTASVSRSILVTSRVATAIEFLSSGAVAYRGQTYRLSARLSRTDTGEPVVGRTLNFQIDDWSDSAPTDLDGVASVLYTIPHDAYLGTRSVTVWFDGDEAFQPSGTEGVIDVVWAAEVWGQVNLGDFVGNYTDVRGRIEVRQYAWYDLALDDAGSFRFYITEPGSYDISVKASHWLRQTLRNVDVTSDFVTIYFSLVNGDIDGDNEVTLFDFGQLVVAFGSVPGDSNWNPDADLDGDREVTLFDFGILVRNFGMVGDE